MRIKLYVCVRVLGRGVPQGLLKCGEEGIKWRREGGEYAEICISLTRVYLLNSRGTLSSSLFASPATCSSNRNNCTRWPNPTDQISSARLHTSKYTPAHCTAYTRMLTKVTPVPLCATQIVHNYIPHALAPISQTNMLVMLLRSI